MHRRPFGTNLFSDGTAAIEGFETFVPALSFG